MGYVGTEKRFNIFSVLRPSEVQWSLSEIELSDLCTDIWSQDSWIIEERILAEGIKVDRVMLSRDGGEVVLIYNVWCSCIVAAVNQLSLPSYLDAVPFHNILVCVLHIALSRTSFSTILPHLLF